MKNKENAGGRLRFNAIDAFIIVLVVICIAVAVLRFTIIDDVWAGAAGDKYYLTFKVESLSYSQLESIVALIDSDNTESGENWVYFQDGKTKIGNLTSIEGQNRETLKFENSDGTITVAPYDEKEPDENVTWTLTGKILCLGKYNENNGFLLNGNQYIAPNSELLVKTAFCEFNMTVIDIEKSME